MSRPVTRLISVEVDESKLAELDVFTDNITSVIKIKDNSMMSGGREPLRELIQPKHGVTY